MAMSSQEKFEYWLDIAQYDLQAAGTMLANKHWLYVAFMCQQAAEKLTKGVYTLYVNDETPRIHNIRAIFEFFGDKLPTKVSDDFLAFFDELSTYYVNNRYPDFKSKLSSSIGEAEANAIFSKTKEVFAWLLTLKP
jgi:HEPN domain-containing protein